MLLFHCWINPHLQYLIHFQLSWCLLNTSLVNITHWATKKASNTQTEIAVSDWSVYNLRQAYWVLNSIWLARDTKTVCLSLLYSQASGNDGDPVACKLFRFSVHAAFVNRPLWLRHCPQVMQRQQPTVLDTGVIEVSFIWVEEGRGGIVSALLRTNRYLFMWIVSLLVT